MTKSTTDDKALATITKEISPVVTKAQALKINDAKTMSQSAEYLSQLNRYLDRLTADKETLTKPANELIKNIRAKYAPVEKPLKEAIALLRTEQSRFQTAEMARQRSEEAKIAAKAAKGSIRLDTAVKKMSEVKQVDDKVITASGQVAFREKPTCEITDVNKIPREYMVPDEDAILTALKAGIDVPGAKITLIAVPYNSR